MGNTDPVGHALVRLKDHPHIHGEYLCKFHGAVRHGGSPPHTWGIRGVLPDDLDNQRITPTYMGNTAIRYDERHSDEDHPHIHGEYEST